MLANSRTQPSIIMVLRWEFGQVVLRGRVVRKCLAYGTSIHQSQDINDLMATTVNYWLTDPQSKNTSHIELPAISSISLCLWHLISCFLPLSLIAGHGRGTLTLTASPEKRIWSIIHEKSLIPGITHLSEKLQQKIQRYSIGWTRHLDRSIFTSDKSSLIIALVM